MPLQVRTTFVAAAKEHKRTGEPKDLKFGGVRVTSPSVKSLGDVEGGGCCHQVSCYGEIDAEFCRSRGVSKFPTVGC